MVNEHRLRRRVQFYETDAAGMVHFTWFFRYMEEAEHALWREAGLSIAPAGAQVGFPRVSATFDFQRPLRFEDEFDIQIAITALNSRTITYACVVSKDGVQIGKGAMTVACVRIQPGQPLQATEIPEEIVGRLSARREPAG